MAKIYSLILFLLVFYVSPVALHAATLSISPAEGTFEVGDRVTVKVVVAGNATPINAVSGMVSISPSVFLIESVSKVGSVLNFWVSEPSYSASQGTVNFEGVALGGYQGESGTVLSITLRVNAPGKGLVTILPGQILANDGEGTNVTGALSGAAFTVVHGKPKISPQVSPIQQKVEKSNTEIEVPPRTLLLAAPEINRLVQDGRQNIIGKSSYPRADILVTFISQDGVKIFVTGVTDEKGGFILSVPTTLRHGVYSVSAMLVTKDNVRSESSNPLLIEIGNIVSDVEWPVILAFFILVSAILYLLVRIQINFKSTYGIREEVRKGVRDAENVLHKSFNVLHEDLVQHAHGKNTPAERKEIAEIKKDINTAEMAIHKEIKDIEP